MESQNFEDLVLKNSQGKEMNVVQESAQRGGLNMGPRIRWTRGQGGQEAQLTAMGPWSNRGPSFHFEFLISQWG